MGLNPALRRLGGLLMIFFSWTSDSCSVESASKQEQQG